jgi:hypothetical protein
MLCWTLYVVWGMFGLNSISGEERNVTVRRLDVNMKSCFVRCLAYYWASAS